MSDAKGKTAIEAFGKEKVEKWKKEFEPEINSSMENLKKLDNVTPEVKKQIKKQLGEDMANLIAPDVDAIGKAIDLGKKAAGEKKDSPFMSIEEKELQDRLQAHKERRPYFKEKKENNTPQIKNPFKTIIKGYKYKLNNDRGVGGQVIQFQRFKPKKNNPTEMALVQQGTTVKGTALMLIDVLEHQKFKGKHVFAQRNNQLADNAIMHIKQALNNLNQIE